MILSLFTLIIPIIVFVLFLYHRTRFRKEKVTRIGLAGFLTGWPLYMLISYLLSGRTKYAELLPFVIVCFALGVAAFYMEFRKGGYKKYKKSFED